ncbi:MAG: winged helix-turn-helix transcriptional regulator [Bacteroidales bacterium]|nr:winged helix-turn-helix transcriptional regulator [Bacteroidales bacterium]
MRVNKDTLKDNFTLEEQILSQLGFALSHPVRIAICELLQEHQSGLTFGEILDKFKFAKSTIFQHIDILKEFGYVKCQENSNRTRLSLNFDNWMKANNILKNFAEL